MTEKPLILIVDDEKDFANNISELIKASGLYDTVVTNSAKEAQEILKKNQGLLGIGKNRIRLAILDIKMPETDGLELLQKIRLDYPTIGAIILTAWEDKDKWKKARDGSVAAYIQKPLMEKNLLAILKRYFAGKEDWMVEQTKWELIAKEEEEGLSSEAKKAKGGKEK